MSSGELAYLGMVVTAFVTFGLGVAWVSWWSARKPSSTNAGQDSPEMIAEVTIRQYSLASVEMNQVNAHSRAA